MKYTIKQVIKNKDKNKYLFFWGHQPSLDTTITKSCFSQWFESTFKIDGVLYKTAEHYMMAEKAKLFKDEEIRKQIIDAKTPGEAKKLGRLVKNFHQDTWLQKRFEIVVKGNFNKFQQNPTLREFLMNTNTRVLVEASPVDDIWGIGMAQNHRDAYHPEKWKGVNLLGFALMEVRDKLMYNK